MADAKAARRDPRRELEELDRVFKALAHPARRQILMVLHFRGGEMTAGGIAGRFACSWPTTSRHLKQLEQAGLVTVESVGRERIYRIDKALLGRTAGEWLRWFEKV
ncbi:MAG: metalloregulator ArsR/SmtB family transcription factor [Planctomycetota bacterium]